MWYFFYYSLILLLLFNFLSLVSLGQIYDYHYQLYCWFSRLNWVLTDWQCAIAQAIFVDQHLWGWQHHRNINYLTISSFQFCYLLTKIAWKKRAAACYLTTARELTTWRVHIFVLKCCVCIWQTLKYFTSLFIPLTSMMQPSYAMFCWKSMYIREDDAICVNIN